MDTILLKVLEMSIYGSIAAIVVLFFRLILRKVPRQITIVFWLAVALRLVCPFNFSSPTSVLNLDDSGVVSKTLDTVTKIEVTKRADGIPDSASMSFLERASIPIGLVVFTVWILGVIIMLSYSIYKTYMVNRFVRTCKKSSDGRYYIAEGIDSPFVTGIFKPKICIPADFDENEREYILRHEAIHVKNHDGLIKYFAYAVLSVHWFNPLVWLSFFLLCSDIEMRVDEEVTSVMDIDMKKAYCLSIVNHAVVEPVDRSLQDTAFSGPGFGGLEAKRRIRNLLTYRKISRLLAVFVLLVTIAASVLASACSFKKDPVQTILTEASNVISTPQNLFPYPNEDNYNYKENVAMREIVDMFLYEGLSIKAVERIYDDKGNFNHQVVLVDENGIEKEVVTNVDGLEGVLAKYSLEQYENFEFDEDDTDSWSDYQLHPYSVTDYNKQHELFINDKILVTTIEW